MARSHLVDDGLWERSSRCWWIAPRSRQGAPSQRPDSVHGDRVCAGDWGTLANGPSADRLFWGDRLAAVAGVAARRGVGETAPRTSPPLERRGVHPCTEQLLRPQKPRACLTDRRARVSFCS
jgi:hypothetical protein